MQFRDEIKELLPLPTFRSSPTEHAGRSLPLFRECIKHAADRHAGYRRYVSSWPVDVDQATQISDLPYLPVSVFKSPDLLSLLPPGAKHRVVSSSGTTTQIPSRIVVDTTTAKLMASGVMTILCDFVGSQRRPYLIIDSPNSVSADAGLNARGAAIRALMPMASAWHLGLTDKMQIDVSELQRFAERFRTQQVLIYGFTYILWFHFVAELRARGLKLDLPQAVVLHSGGWKKLTAEAVDKATFNDAVAQVVGCRPERIIDYYGLVENLGVVYPDCEQHNKHVPNFAHVSIRSPLTLQPVSEGETGIIQVGSLLPESFPGHLLLTEDLGTVVTYDGCPCGRRGMAFRLDGRIPRAELRGCGDVLAQKLAA